jgi:hypothetical protein
MILACNTEEEFSITATVQVYDPATDVYSSVNWTTAGYVAGDPLSDLTKGKLTFTLTAQINGSIPSIGILGVPTTASLVSFKMLTASLAILTFNAPTSKMVCDYVIEYEKTGGNDNKKEVGQFIFN